MTKTKWARFPKPKFAPGDVVVMRKYAEVPARSDYEIEKKLCLARHIVYTVAYGYPDGPYLYWIRDDHQAFHLNIFSEHELCSNKELTAKVQLEKLELNMKT